MTDRTEIIIHMDADIDPDRLVTFIKEKCSQENLRVDVDVHGRFGKKMIAEQREKFSKPIDIGSKTAIKVLTPRTKHFGFKPYVSDRNIITIDATGAFGTGTHQTTQMCVEAIEKYLKPDDTVLDVGCGSAILSLISLSLGAAKAVGVDINDTAVTSAMKNAELNDMSSKFTAINGDLVSSVTDKYDLVVGNLLADPIKALLPNVWGCMKEDATLILSGIVDFRENEIIEIAEEHGFSIIQREERDNWILLVLKYKNF